MFEILSQRAEALLKAPQHRLMQKKDTMRFFKGELLHCWVDLEIENGSVKNLSYYGDLDPALLVLIEALARIMRNKSLAHFESMTLRECEAFLRDKNSQASLSKLTNELEVEFKRLCTWLRLWPTSSNVSQNFDFDSKKMVFKNLSLVEKIKIIKLFFRSSQVLTLYAGLPAPELIDVVDLDIFIEVPYETEEERELLHHLQELAVEIFQEPEFNFIPESV